MPTLISTTTPDLLLPAVYPELAKTEAGKFGASLTLAKGTVLGKKTSDSKLYAYVHPNAVQTLAIVGTLSAGGFRLRIVDKDGIGQTTALIAYNANTAAIQAAVDAVIPTGLIVVGGTAITASTFTFSGALYAALPQVLIEVYPDGLTGMTSATVTDSTTYTGLQTPVGFTEYPIKTDASGNVFLSDSIVASETNRSTPDSTFFFSGIFKSADLTGWDTAAATAMNARTLPSGNIYIP